MTEDSAAQKEPELDHGTPLDGWTALLGIPSYGPVDPACQKDVRVAMVVASKYGLVWEGDVSTDRMGWSHGRNMMAQHCLEMEDVTGLMCIDSDMRIPPDSIARLLATARRHKIEFMTGVYHQRGGYHTPVFYHWSDAKQAFQPYKDYPEKSLYQIEGCGFGFVWVARRVFHEVAIHKDFNPKRGWFPDDRDSGGFGEDMSFCRAVMKTGIPLMVDTGVQLGHMGDPEIVTQESYIKKRSETKWTSIKASEAENAGKWGIKGERDE